MLSSFPQGAGRFYFVDAAHAPSIAERFQHWPEAAIVYFSILVTDCKAVIEEPYARVLVVKDHVLGTNDCRGWVRESLYKKLNRLLHRWAKGKQESRSAWAQAMATVVTNGNGSGGVLFNTFPQEFCDLLAENTGGRKVRVHMPRLGEGHIVVEEGSKMISIYPYRNEDRTTGEHRALIAEYTGNPGFNFSEGVLYR